MTKPGWILVANASHARLFQQEKGGAIVQIADFRHPQSRQHSSELGDDKAGRELSGRGFGGAPFEPHVDAQHKQYLQFARELADRLEREGLEGRYASRVVLMRLSCGPSQASVMLFASSPFLGELKHALGDATQRLLAGCHDVDLTSVGLAEMEGRIRQELARER